MSNVNTVELNEMVEKQLVEVISEVAELGETKEQKSKNDKYHIDKLNEVRKNDFFYDLYKQYGLSFETVPENLREEYQHWYQLVRGTKLDPYHTKQKEVLIKKAKQQEKQAKRALEKAELKKHLQGLTHKEIDSLDI